MGLFGWSYPPGAANDPFAPYNQTDPPCEVCGALDVDDCVCPECPVCGGQGDPDCCERHGMTVTMEQLHGQALLEDSYREQAKADKAEGDYWANRCSCQMDITAEQTSCPICGGTGQKPQKPIAA